MQGSQSRDAPPEIPRPCPAVGARCDSARRHYRLHESAREPWRNALVGVVAAPALLGGVVCSFFEIGPENVLQLWRTRPGVAAICVTVVGAGVMFLIVQGRSEPVTERVGTPQVEAEPAAAGPSLQPSAPTGGSRETTSAAGAVSAATPPRIKTDDGGAAPAPQPELLNPAAFDPSSPAVIALNGGAHDREVSAALASALHGTDALFTAEFFKAGAYRASAGATSPS